MKHIRQTHPKPGDIYHDVDGCISGCNPTTYLLLSGQSDRKDKWVYKLASFYDGNYWRLGWSGAPIVEMWECDIAKLKLVGSLQTRHVYWPRLKRNLKKRWIDWRCIINAKWLNLKYGKPFYEQQAYWRDFDKS